MEIQRNWEQSLSDISKVESNRAARLVLLHSYLYLPSIDYMKCLERLLDLVQQGKLSEDEFIHIFLIPPRDENRWFLSYNSEAPQMVQWLSRARKVFAKNKAIAETLDLIASGKARTRDERLRSEDPASAKRPVPRLTEP